MTEPTRPSGEWQPIDTDRSTGQVLAELAEDKQDAGERAVFRFRAELAVPGELEKGLAELVDEDDDPPRETDVY